MRILVAICFVDFWGSVGEWTVKRRQRAYAVDMLLSITWAECSRSTLKWCFVAFELVAAGGLWSCVMVEVVELSCRQRIATVSFNSCSPQFRDFYAVTQGWNFKWLDLQHLSSL